MSMTTNIVARVWCSPRLDSQYPWKWAVQNNRETLEFGAERTEYIATREAEKALSSWLTILSKDKGEQPSSIP